MTCVVLTPNFSAVVRAAVLQTPVLAEEEAVAEEVVEEPRNQCDRDAHPSGRRADRPAVG